MTIASCYHTVFSIKFLLLIHSNSVGLICLKAKMYQSNLLVEMKRISVTFPNLIVIQPKLLKLVAIEFRLMLKTSL